ncbi:hypothetical protein [Kribbella pratensis]|uniref:Uncharacterized protein n=1 Tax=Kribbella pratensis TaxID=2512112 RepID=A0A4R8BZ21_9ACTN|nr:hypothetical protein [Kribbella pratensis]TDW66433.1 hypothetical protein EV653_6461 [Kribbella pratensis]
MADLQQFEDDYDRAEAAYISALRADLSRTDLADLAGVVAAAAAEFNTEAYRNLQTSSGDDREELDRLTDLTETLSELWSDIHSAYLGQ